MDVQILMIPPTNDTEFYKSIADSLSEAEGIKFSSLGNMISATDITLPQAENILDDVSGNYYKLNNILSELNVQVGSVHFNLVKHDEDDW